MSQSVRLNEDEICIVENVLDLSNSEIERISQIKGLEECQDLKVLNLADNSLTSLEGLSILKSLEMLQLRNNNIISIKGLENLKNLEFLDLSNNEISEITSLETLIELGALHLDGNHIKKISGLENTTKLLNLSLSNNHIKKIEGLDSLKKLESLSLSINPINIINGLNNLINLKVLVFINNPIEEIQGLDQLTNLRILSFIGCNRITKIQGLENLTGLKQLNLSSCNIKKIEGLSSLKALELLDLRNNKITKIEGLKKLKNLNILNLEYNKITNLDGLGDLSKLKQLFLRNNELAGNEKFLVESPGTVKDTINYCKTKEIQRRQLIFSKYYNHEMSPEENLENFGRVLSEATKDDVIHLGTHKQDIDIKIIQNALFYRYKPTTKYLLARKRNLKRVNVHLIQINSLKGMKYKQSEDNKIYHFQKFVNIFWDNGGIENEVLIYGDKANRLNKKIEEILDIIFSDENVHPNLIIFPENSVPYSKIRYLIKKSYERDCVIIFGVEHKFINGKYKNKVIIVDHGIMGVQLKQTPVRVYKEDNSFLQEKIKCSRFPEIDIFNTSLGRIAIFICKDFLRLNEVIIDWAWANRVDFIIVPSLTSKVLPFHSKLLELMNYAKYQRIRIIFTNIGEYGGSEYFSIQKARQIEKRFRLNKRDNVGEVIVVREDELPEPQCEICGNIQDLETSRKIIKKIDDGELEIDLKRDIKLICKSCIRNEPSLVFDYEKVLDAIGETFEDWEDWVNSITDPYFDQFEFFNFVYNNIYEDDIRFNALNYFIDYLDGSALQEMLQNEVDEDIKNLLHHKLNEFKRKNPYYEF